MFKYAVLIFFKAWALHVHCMIHNPSFGPEVICQWAENRGHTFSETKVYEGEALPKAFDMLVLLGGYNYEGKELKLIRKAIKDEKVVIGFCLGAQMIGTALGTGPVISPETERGLLPVTLSDEGKRDPALHGFPESFTGIHWHKYMPGLPKGAVLLARSEGCPNQGFRYGDRTYALQFHLEVTEEQLTELLEEPVSRDEVVEINERCCALFDQVVKNIGE